MSFLLRDFSRGLDPKSSCSSAYEHAWELASPVFIEVLHCRRTGVKLLAWPLDTAPESDNKAAFVHFTDSKGIRGILHPARKQQEVRTSKVTDGPWANALFGQGVYVLRKGPYLWPSKEAIIYNNWKSQIDDGSETYDSLRPKVEYAIVVLVKPGQAISPQCKQTRDMRDRGVPAGHNLRWQELGERDLVVLQCDGPAMSRKGAQMQLLPLLKRRADACGLTLGPSEVLTLQTRHALAKLLVLAREEASAAGVLQGLACTMAEKLGKDHPETLALRQELAHCLRLSRQHLAWCREEMCAVLEARTKQLGDMHLDTLSAREELAKVNIQINGSGDAALAWQLELDQVKEARQARLPEDASENSGEEGNQLCLISCAGLCETVVPAQTQVATQARALAEVAVEARVHGQLAVSAAC